jgi:hypothetical protein
MAAMKENIPMAWQQVLAVIVICKAAIAGAGLALAILGALNIVAAISAHEWLESAKHTYALDAFAVGGGIIGALVKAIFK